MPSVLSCCWLGDRKGIWPVKMSGGVLASLSVWSKMQTCIWPSWCHWHSLSLASVKFRLVFTFLVPAHLGSPRQRLLNCCVCVCVWLQVRVSIQLLSRNNTVAAADTRTELSALLIAFCISLIQLLLLLHPFNSLFSRTTWVSRYQKGKTSLDLNEARDYRVSGCNGISWSICKQSAPCSIQITTPTPHHLNFFTDDALLDAQTTVSKHCRQYHWYNYTYTQESTP